MMTTKTTLPAGWHWMKLDEVCLILSGSTPKKINTVSGNGEIPWFRVSDMTIPGNEEFLVQAQVSLTEEETKSLRVRTMPAGTILFPKRGGAIATNKKRILHRVSGFDLNIMGLIPNSYELDGRYLWYWFLTVDLGKLSNGSNVPQINHTDIEPLLMPIAPLTEQKRIAAQLNGQMAALAQARQAAEEQLGLLDDLINAYLRDSLASQTTKKLLAECFVEVKKGVGKNWQNYPVIGATRAGVAPAKEKVGKQPERYKLVEPGYILYNPMRINIGSIAMLDEGDQPGITSPDYVVFRSKEGIVHPRWFYYWFRSPYGEGFIKTFARGAVRERMLFNRLANGEIELPSWDVQCQVAEKLKEIKALKQSLKAQLAEINQLPSALLRRAFNGEL